jgi:hypothetical protein
MSHWGSTPDSLADNDIRFLFQNVNGLSTQASVYAEVQANIVRLGTHVVAMGETNLNWRNFTIRDMWESTLQRQYAKLFFSHSSCNEGSSPCYQRGGTSMLCNSRLGARLLDRGADSELGRWSWMKFRGRQGHHVLVITAYQVSQSSPSGLGHETFYMQQWRKIVPTIPSDEPRKRFWTDLTTFISSAPNNTAILLMLDANADTSDPLFSRFCSDCNLEDFHGNVSLQPAPETYFRGSRCIDYILGTPDIAQAITQVGILGYADGLKYSDHCALFIDIQEDLLFSDKGVDPTARRSRGLRTKNKKQVQEYCCLLKQQCAAHNILSRVRVCVILLVPKVPLLLRPLLMLLIPNSPPLP